MLLIRLDWATYGALAPNASELSSASPCGPAIWAYRQMVSREASRRAAGHAADWLDESFKPQVAMRDRPNMVVTVFAKWCSIAGRTGPGALGCAIAMAPRLYVFPRLDAGRITAGNYTARPGRAPIGC